MKKILLTFLILTNIDSKVEASSDYLFLNNLDFQVQVNSDGSMDVTEKWNIEIENTNEKIIAIINANVFFINSPYFVFP